MQTGSELRENKKSLSLWLWVPTHLASCARLTDVSCFWKMNHLSFYDSSVIPMVPCQDSLLPVSFPRRGQHVRCLCHFKHSLMPSFFLCAFYKKTPPYFSLWLPIAQPIILASRSPSFCSVSCWLHPYSQDIITSAKAATAVLRYITFQLQTFGPLLWPLLTALDSFTGLQQPKIWKQVHSFSSRYSSDWVCA